MRENLREVLYASGRIPVLYPVRAHINGTRYVDGGFIDKNPVTSLFARGCDRALAIVSNPEGIVRESFFNPGESKAVRAARREGRLVVIKPARELGVSKYSWSVPRVERAVRWGNEAGEDFLKEQGEEFFSP
jgi:predicted patatin/cPLA2 family phospholipase